MSVHPTVADLSKAVQLRKHKVQGAFESVDDYLDIQFRLLREDFVATIRQGISEFKKNPTLKGAGRFRSGDVKVYEKMTIDEAPNFGKTGLTYFTSMDMESAMFRRTNWSSSKRLMYGSLLCLSPDYFDQINLFATISNRNNDVMSSDGTFEIQFLPESQIKFNELANKKGPFIAMESTAYFEAYSPILSGMQRLDATNFPLARYIVSGNTDLHRPEYLKSIEGRYRFIGKDDQITKPLSISGGYGGSWPTAEQLGFNGSQYEAFKLALCSEFVVIQGPPGTGKTYVGLKIVQCLLYNLYNVPHSLLTSKESAKSFEETKEDERKQQMKQMRCPPRSLNQMLVVCYTNHALDQFLEGMLSFCPAEDIVRIGGRSKSEALEPCLYINQRVKRSKSMYIAQQDVNAKQQKFQEDYRVNTLQDQANLSRMTILTHDTAGLFHGHEALYYQIYCMAFYLDSDGKDPDLAMTLWLGYDAASYAVISREKQEQNTSTVPEQKTATVETIDIECDAGRELQNRMGDEGDNDKALERIRRIYNSVSRQITVKDDDGFTLVTKSGKQGPTHKQFVSQKLNSTDIMSEQEVSNLEDQIEAVEEFDITTKLSMNDRWRLYRTLVKDYQHLIALKMAELQKGYVELTDMAEEIRRQQVVETLQSCKVIGMTTTGAAKNQSVLQEVGPEIVVVEEAAEVLEAHITTALSQNCKHLILIGDHKQLKPNPTVYALAKEYHLDLSLFERMVNNGLPVKTLNTQHRMRPEVSKFMRHIYDRLDDHESVEGREPIEGVISSVFFFDHRELETSDDILMSKSNEFEACMVVGLTRYLLKQESYEPEDITIITMYTGQLLLLKNKMPKYEFDGVKVTSVDNFQGEENKIIILSLVRSNKENSLGFVNIENRVCVALSRAQHGMYVFGNFDMLSRGSGLWMKIVNDAKEAKELGPELVLRCRRHGNFATIKKPTDFQDKVPAGGCKLMCDEKLKCGHICKSRCHSKDFEHNEYKCTENCPKLMTPCNHPCPNMCHQKCQDCRVIIQKQLPCGHIKDVACHLTHTINAKIPCEKACTEMLDCGHQCAENCSELCTSECKVKVKQTCSQCSEVKDVECYIAKGRLMSGPASQKYSFECNTPCEEILPCQHQCSGTCYKCSSGGHAECIKHCGKMLKCGHICKQYCYDCKSDGGCGECSKRCLLKCSHNVQCSQSCNKPCEFVTKDDTPACEWGCKHDKCERPCGESCSHLPCDRWCEKTIKCDKCQQHYPCTGLCGDPCPLKMCLTCDQPTKLQALKQQIAGLEDKCVITAATRWVQLSDCLHTVPANYMHKLVYDAEPQSIIRCPYKVCSKAVLNTPRYISRTREYKPGTSHRQRMPASLPPQSDNVLPFGTIEPAVGQSGDQMGPSMAKRLADGLLSGDQQGSGQLAATGARPAGKKITLNMPTKKEKRSKPPKRSEVAPPPIPSWLKLGSHSIQNDLDEVAEQLQRSKASLTKKSEFDSSSGVDEAAGKFNSLRIDGNVDRDGDDGYLDDVIDF